MFQREILCRRDSEQNVSTGVSEDSHSGTLESVLPPSDGSALEYHSFIPENATESCLSSLVGSPTGPTHAALSGVLYQAVLGCDSVSSTSNQWQSKSNTVSNLYRDFLLTCLCCPAQLSILVATERLLASEVQWLQASLNAMKDLVILMGNVMGNVSLR